MPTLSAIGLCLVRVVFSQIRAFIRVVFSYACCGTNIYANGETQTQRHIHRDTYTETHAH